MKTVLKILLVLVILGAIANTIQALTNKVKINIGQVKEED